MAYSFGEMKKKHINVSFEKKTHHKCVNMSKNNRNGQPPYSAFGHGSEKQKYISSKSISTKLSAGFVALILSESLKLMNELSNGFRLAIKNVRSSLAN